MIYLFTFSIVLSRTLFISGIPASLNQAQLKEMMEEIGRIESVRASYSLFIHSVEMHPDS